MAAVEKIFGTGEWLGTGSRYQKSSKRHQTSTLVQCVSGSLAQVLGYVARSGT